MNEFDVQAEWFGRKYILKAFSIAWFLNMAVEIIGFACFIASIIFGMLMLMFV